MYLGRFDAPGLLPMLLERELLQLNLGTARRRLKLQPRHSASADS